MKNMIKKLEEITNDFKFMKIGVIGDLMLDRTEKGVISKRKNPENENVPIILAREEFYLGGCGNVARNLSALGVNVDLYGVIGKDLYGHQVKKICKKNNLSTRFLIEDKNPTILKARTFIDGEYKHRSDLGEIDENYEKNLENLTGKNYSKILLNLEKEIARYDALILSDYDKRMFTNYFSQRVIEIANSNNVPVICDAKPRNISYFKGSFAVCPNKEEAEKMSGMKYNKNNVDLERIGRKISQENNIKNVIITCGENGVFAYNSEEIFTQSSYARKVVDVTGAGDTFTALFSLGIASELNIFDSIKLGNFAAGIVVEKLGTSTLTNKEIIERIKEIGKDL